MNTGLTISASLSPRRDASDLAMRRPGPATNFAERLASAGRTREADPARRAAEEFVAISLIEPALKQLRETNNAAPPFGPGEGEEQFRAMLDAEIAREITRASRFPLVDRLARDLRVSGSTEAPIPARSASPLAGGAGV